MQQSVLVRCNKNIRMFNNTSRATILVETIEVKIIVSFLSKIWMGQIAYLRTFKLAKLQVCYWKGIVKIDCLQNPRKIKPSKLLRRLKIAARSLSYSDKYEYAGTRSWRQSNHPLFLEICRDDKNLLKFSRLTLTFVLQCSSTEQIAQTIKMQKS